MNEEQIIDFLLENASANIKYRVKRDILQEPIDSIEMQNLQEQILELPKIKKTFATQKENGFLGNELHGGYFNGFDTNFSYLLRNGVEISNPNLQRAKQALLNWKYNEDDYYFPGGKAMDEHGPGGIKAMIADMMLNFKCDENTPHIQEYIEISLNNFKGALNHNNINDFTKECTYKGRKVRYYIKGAAFPSAFHLNILNKTTSWRTTENVRMFEKSYKHCEKIINEAMPDGGTIFVNCGHLVGPFNINWKEHQRKEVISINEFIDNPIDFAWWMRSLPGKRIVDRALTDWIFKDDVLSATPEIYLKKYTGLWAIEPSWRKQKSKLCDLYFPAIINLHNVELV